MSSFSERLVRWQRAHGRHHLPWQGTQDPYRVWLSEVMLQQTQVATVVDYYQRFLRQFPTVDALAQAAPDDVLALWSGLGYYSRARNLHRCAQQVCEQGGGRFPQSAAELVKLSGIGPSTGAAIAAFCFNERVAILDGNVMRVLARFLGERSDIASVSGRRLLQQHADRMLPDRAADMPAYTQALMDLGATVCVPKNPDCGQCPLRNDCVARATEEVQTLPVKIRKLKRRAESWWLWCPRRRDGAVWLVRRPGTGVWAGLYAPMVFDGESALCAHVGCAAFDDLRSAPVFKHVLTHKDLFLHVMWQEVDEEQATLPFSHEPGQWLTPQQWDDVGLPAPVRRMLNHSVRI